MSKRAMAAQPAHRRRPKRRKKTTQLGIASLFLFLVLLLVKTNAHPLENKGKDEACLEEKPIAIHLGAIKSRVGVVSNNQVRILGSIPSYVTATDTGIVAGDAAKDSGGPNLFTAALDMMNYFADKSSGSTVFNLPGSMFGYSMQNGHQTLQVVLSNGTSSSFTPTEIFAPILSQLHSLAQSYLGPWASITSAVMVFPHPYGYNDIASIDNFVDDIRRAGEMVNLPIIRTMHETTTVGIALGLDIISETAGERYAILYDLADDFNTLTITVFEVEDSVFDTLSFHRENHVSDAGYLEKEHTRFADTKNSGILTRLDEGFTLEHPVSDNREANTGCLQGTPCLSCHIQRASIHAIHHALTTAGLSVDQITDLIFMPAFRSFPRLQRRVAGWFNNNTRIGNSDNLDEAAVWGAAIVSKNIADDNWWVGGSCSKSPPAIGISTADNRVFEIIPAAQSLPSFGNQTFITPCGHEVQARNTTVIKVYLRDIPAVDYHAKFELGDQYIFDPTPEDIFLGEFNLSTPCDLDQFLNPAAIGDSALLNRDSVLRVQATNMDSGESATVTFSDVSTHCGHDERYSPQNFTVTSGESLELNYQLDLRRFVGPSRDQKPVDAFDRALFSYP